MIGFLIFFLTDIFISVVFMAVYGGRRGYKNGMLLGVHVPETAVRDPEVEAFMADYRKRNKWFYYLNIVASGAVCFLLFWHLSIFMIVWSLWLIQLIAGAFWMLYGANRKLYEMKVRRGWGTGDYDGDCYWKNGWYDNPEDNRLLVPDRFCAANYTMNMGKKAGKIVVLSGIGLTLALLVWLNVMFLRVDFIPWELAVSDGKVSISSTMYAISFSKDDVKRAELLDAMPDESLRKTNGLSDNQQLVGEFRGSESGDSRIYVYRDHSPVLKIELPEYTVYINSQKEEQTEEWYQMLEAE